MFQYAIIMFILSIVFLVCGIVMLVASTKVEGVMEETLKEMLKTYDNNNEIKKSVDEAQTRVG